MYDDEEEEASDVDADDADDDKTEEEDKTLHPTMAFISIQNHGVSKAGDGECKEHGDSAASSFVSAAADAEGR